VRHRRARLDDTARRPDNARRAARIHGAVFSGRVRLKGKIQRRDGRVTLELDMTEWSYLKSKSILMFARKAANGPLFANDAASPDIERLARTVLDELGFERGD
jgi:hypothetical protein